MHQNPSLPRNAMFHQDLKRLDGLLSCPQCQRRLSVSVDGTQFACEEHGSFPNANGIPSFVSGYDPAFEDHWERNVSDDLPQDKLRLAHEFLAPVLRRFPADKPITVLDAGCGEGAHMRALAQARSALDLGIGLDIAMSALRPAGTRGGKNWSVIHGDMMQLPCTSASFDVVFSFGVLALTPDPKVALAEMVRVLKPGGIVGFWVFPGASTLMRTGLRVLRGISRALGPSGATWVANAIVPFYGLIPTRSGLSLGNSSWRQTREVLMSNLTPPFLHFLPETQLRSWLNEMGVDVIDEGDGVPTTLWGIKR